MNEMDDILEHLTSHGATPQVVIGFVQEFGVHYCRVGDDGEQIAPCPRMLPGDTEGAVKLDPRQGYELRGYLIGVLRCVGPGVCAIDYKTVDGATARAFVATSSIAEIHVGQEPPPSAKTIITN